MRNVPNPRPPRAVAALIPIGVVAMAYPLADADDPRPIEPRSPDPWGTSAVLEAATSNESGAWVGGMRTIDVKRGSVMTAVSAGSPGDFESFPRRGSPG